MSNNSYSQGAGLVFRKVETLFFCFLCFCFLVLSKSNPQLSRNISSVFVSFSLPIVSFISYPFNSLIGLLVNFKELSDAKKENLKLKEELNRLKVLELSAINIEAENRELLATANFIRFKSNSYNLARIIGISNQAFNNKIFIDFGDNKSVKEGQIVVGQIGVIGRINEIFYDKARLMMPTDSDSRIPVISSQSRLRGILAGNNSELMEIYYLPKNHQIEIGEEIYTSGDGETLPPGLLIGVVKEIKKDSVLVSMVESPNKINFVSVVNF
jgi:rod shape-determining protein MreC